MPWASVTRRPWVRTTLWYRLSPGRRRERHHHYRLSPRPEYNNPFSPRMQQGFTRGFFRIGKPSLFAWHVARTEDTIQLRRSCKRWKEKKIKAERKERKIHKPPWCRKWHSRLNIMLLVTASVADRLVGCWLERDCLPVCRRSRPHTLLTSAMEQQTIQQPCRPTGGQTGQPNTHNK